MVVVVLSCLRSPNNWVHKFSLEPGYVQNTKCEWLHGASKANQILATEIPFFLHYPILTDLQAGHQLADLISESGLVAFTPIEPAPRRRKRSP